jgi:hypothetical protein
MLSVEVHLAEGQFLLEEQTLNKEKSDMLSRKSMNNIIQKRRAEFIIKINLNKK